MGQGGNNSNDSRGNGGKRPARQTCRGYLATLVVLALGIASVSAQAAHRVHRVGRKSKPAHRQTQASTHFDQDRAWTHLVNQVSFGPRVPGTTAHDKCEQYILDETKKYCDNVRA